MFRLLVASTRRSVGVVTAAGATVAAASYRVSKTKAEEVAASHEEEPLFEGQCLERQLYRPKVPYPAWDFSWDDGRDDDGVVKGGARTRHVLLIRHGQYDMSSKDDKLRILTPLGRRQADLTGQRLALLARGGLQTSNNEDDDDGEAAPVPQACPITAIYSSDMTRAKETAAIIARWFANSPEVILYDPDPLLNEALPSPVIPPRPEITETIAEVDEHHDRIEEAFQKYIAGRGEDTDDTSQDHSFKVLVCHGNVIRYFFCRALQLPPEAWLRMSTYNCSITYLVIYPSGRVSARMMGDTGHIPYEDTTFSGHYGYV
jgi:serine/threonine-protein phosphatase PGAM5